MIIEPRQLEQGICVAGAVLPPRTHNVPTRIVNTSNRHIRLEKGETLSEVQVLNEHDIIENKQNNFETGQNVDEEWLEKLVETVHSSVTTAEKQRLKRILRSYADCFSRAEFDLGHTDVVRHCIDTGNQRPIKQVLRRHPVHHNEEIDRQIDEMLKQDVIERSNSPWSSNVVIVKKKDHTLRMCIDYRRLNDVTVKDSYPLPRIADCLDALSTGKYFSAFDLRSGYFQVAMDEADKDKTSFVTRSGLYRFKVMPFGLTNAPATFQRLMDLTMAGLNYSICLVYLDDIILMSRRPEREVPDHSRSEDGALGAGLVPDPGESR